MQIGQFYGSDKKLQLTFTVVNNGKLTNGIGKFQFNLDQSFEELNSIYYPFRWSDE